MPTSSIFHNIEINTPEELEKLLMVFKESEEQPNIEVKYQKDVKVLTKEEIKELFGEIK